MTPSLERGLGGSNRGQRESNPRRCCCQCWQSLGRSQHRGSRCSCYFWRPFELCYRGYPWEERGVIRSVPEQAPVEVTAQWDRSGAVARTVCSPGLCSQPCSLQHCSTDGFSKRMFLTDIAQFLSYSGNRWGVNKKYMLVRRHTLLISCYIVHQLDVMLRTIFNASCL